MRPEKTHGSGSQKGERNLTRLCQGCLLYFANITSARPFSSWNFNKLLVNDEITASCQANMFLKHYIKRYKQRR